MFFNQLGACSPSLGKEPTGALLIIYYLTHYRY